MKPLITAQHLHLILGGIHTKNSTLFVLAQGDTLTLPTFTIDYPSAMGPSNAYTLNGNPVFCTNVPEDNFWSVPSSISNSFCSADNVTVQTDGTYLYVQAVYSNPYMSV